MGNFVELGAANSVKAKAITYVILDILKSKGKKELKPKNKFKQIFPPQNLKKNSRKFVRGFDNYEFVVTGNCGKTSNETCQKGTL